jgi:hypothetical protein
MINAFDVKLVLNSLEIRFKKLNLPLGSFRNEPDSLAKRMDVHFNTIANWKNSRWQNMKVENLITMLELLQKAEKDNGQ